MNARTLLPPQVMSAGAEASQQASTGDQITILTSFGPFLAKRWTAGGIQPYDKAKHFRAQVVDVADIHELSQLLRSLENMPQSCVIRGAPRATIDKSNTTRTLEAFYEVPRSWACFDVDDWNAAEHGLDPIANPEAAVRAFIEKELPPEFHHASCHWQLSNSAGAPGKWGILKAHIWWWLEHPYGEVELTAWARALSLPIDVTTFRVVQVHYTSAPVVEEGASCPVRLRSGLIEGLLYEAVPLQIDKEVLNKAFLNAARVTRAEMVDPTAKGGIVGAFCRAYPPARAVDELLAGHFEWEGDDGRRLTWLGGGGAPGGAVITDDGLHVYNAHASDPACGRAVNAFDLCRMHLFGEADRKVPADTPVNGLPSFVEMSRLARTLPDVKAELAAARVTAAEDFDEFVDDPEDARAAAEQVQRDRQAREEREAKERAERKQRVETLRLRVLGASDVEALKQVCTDIAADDTIDDVDREGTLVPAVQDRHHQITGSRLRIKTARDLVYPAASGGPSGGPDWLSRWVYVVRGDTFFGLDDKREVSARGFDALHSEKMPLTRDNRRREGPAEWAIRVWSIEKVDAVLYAPGQPEVFEALGRRWANSYDPSSVPAATPGDGEIVKILMTQLELMFPDARERELLLAWLAHNVRWPGKKIRWSPYVFGAEGTGKTFLAELLELVMGDVNVRVVSGTTLKSDFNGWASGAAVVVLEEVYQTGHFLDIEEKLKAPIANDVVDVHRKGKDSITAPNFSNYLLLSNHPDGLPVGSGNRRLFFLHVAITEQRAKELGESGYYARLFKGCRERASELRHWLLSVAEHLPDEFDADGRAPETAARRDVIELSRGEAEATLADAIGDGWAFSAKWARSYLKDAYVDFPRTRAWNAMVAKLGFNPVPVMVNVEGEVGRLYYKQGLAMPSLNDLRREVARVASRAPCRDEWPAEA